MDARFFAVVGVAFLLVLGLVGWNVGTSGQARGTDVPASPASSSDVRRFSFEYAVEIPADLAPETEGPVTVFLPIAQDATGQVILDFEVESEFVGQIELESDYGNRFWRAEIPARRPKDTTIVVRYDVERSVVRSGDEPGSEEHAKRFLAASERVVVDHPVLEPILEEIRANASRASAVERSRAIYDWVVDNVEYKKVGTGWGNGDTFWACNERYGNCTDFHSLFISLARTEGIPARFEMGFPVPTDRAEGSVAGYHCWVEFWLPDVGWIPVDASEAFKYPEKRELFFGTQPADRIQFTTGRDLRLGPSHLDRALNYFIYPYVEIAGKHWDVELPTRIAYHDVSPASGP